ncbi:MAG: hypothetical protein J6Y49_00430 [Alphaproteobacteria bacterium]|nr:hypothetical protein [Alphaproteobacteria bacterium]
MKNLAHLFVISVFLGGISNNAKSLDLTGNTISDADFTVYEDITVHDGVLFEAHDIKVVDNLHIFNFGEIAGTVNVCANCTVELENTGVFGANVSLQSGAHFVQVISSNASATDIGLNSGYDIAVRDANGIDLNNITQLAAHADSVSFTNARFSVGNMYDFNAPENIYLSGDVILSFDSVVNSPLLLFLNATGDGVVYVDSDALDVLHVFQTYKVDNDIFVRLVRSTDYARILKNDKGRFLNDLRASGTDNKLFSKLDRAQTMSEINGILSDSVRTNPIKLMEPVSLMYSHKMLESMYIEKGVVLGLKPFFVYSSDVALSGIQPSVKINPYNNLHLELSGYFMNIDRSDDINEYTGRSLGGGLDAQYDVDNDDFVRVHVGANKTYFNVGPVFNGRGATNNPDGTYLYAIGEYGHQFNLSGGYNVSPFITVGEKYVGVLDCDDTKLFAGGGADFKYGYEFAGLRYDYIARALIQTDKTFGVGFGVSAWSVFDAAGGDMHIAVVHDDVFGMSFSVALNGRFRF